MIDYAVLIVCYYSRLLDGSLTLDAQVLFVVSSQITLTAEESALCNASVSYVQERGWNCINFNTDQMFQELELNPENDFLDVNHMNYLGAEKYTDWLCAYLKSNYSLDDHRGDAAYQMREDGYAYYSDYVADGITRVKK